MKNGIKILLIIVCLVTVIFIIGGSYAYFTAYDTSEQQVVKVDNLEITYETGQDILMENALPQPLESIESSPGHQFTIRNTGDRDINYNVVFSEISLIKDNQDTFSNYLGWAIYSTDSSYQNETFLKSGSFSSLSGFLSGDKELVIKTDIPLKKGESHSFILKVGLVESGGIQNRDAGLDLSFKMQVDTFEREEAVSKQSIYHYKEGESPVITDEQKASVTKIILQNRIAPIEGAETSLDFSPNQDGSCMVYLVENQDEAGTYTVYFQGNDEIWLEEGIRFFQSFIKLREIENIEILNTSQVTSMWNMFAGCVELTSLDLSHFDTSNVTDMWGMFAQCSKLTNLNISNFDTSKVTRMAWMFENTGLTGIDLSHFDTSQVTDMSGMFYNIQNLKWVDVSSFDTSKVENMEQMFNNCVQLKNLNLANFNTSVVTDMHDMFSGCNSLTSLNVSNFDTSKVTQMGGMFNGCWSLLSLDLSSFVTSSVTNMRYMFYDCGQLTKLDVSRFDTSQVLDMTRMFGYCRSLISLNLSNFNTENVTDMSFMFVYCTSLTFLDVSSFMTTNVTNMNGMFSHCTALANLNLSNFSTPKVTNMQTMFDSCTNLSSLNLSSFDMSKVQNTKWMFSSCRNLKAIKFGNFNYSSIVDSEAMFSGVNANIVITITNSDAVSWLQDKLASGSVVVSA